jgi:hypothetical protein
VSQSAVVERLQIYGAALERQVRDLGDEQLRRSGRFHGEPITTAEVVERIAVGHGHGHLDPHGFRARPRCDLSSAGFRTRSFAGRSGCSVRVRCASGKEPKCGPHWPCRPAVSLLLYPGGW